MFRLSPSGLNDFPMLGIPLYALFGCRRRDKSCASILRRNHWPMSRRCQPFPSSDRKPSCVDAPATLKLPLSNSERRVKRFRVPGPSMRRNDEGVPASGVRSSRPRCLLSAVLRILDPDTFAAVLARFVPGSGIMLGRVAVNRTSNEIGELSSPRTPCTRSAVRRS